MKKKRFFLTVAVLCGILFVHTAIASAAENVSAAIDATQPNFLQADGFGPMQKGYTDVVPPLGVDESIQTYESADGYRWDMYGVEYSAWQTTALPDRGRYLLGWHFEYSGTRLSTSGRMGFTFGNPPAFMSVEVDMFGVPRIMQWGPRDLTNQGKIVWRGKATSRTSKISIVADYDIRREIMTLSVNGGPVQTVDFGKLGISSPLTIKTVGFFGAVNEAQATTGGFKSGKGVDLDVDMTRQFASVRHERLTVEGTSAKAE